MLDDARTLLREFDPKMFFDPSSTEQFVLNLVILVMFAVCLVVAWHALRRLWL